MNRLISVIIISFLLFYAGCGKKKDPKYILIDNPQLMSDFRIFFEQRRHTLRQALLDNGIRTDEEQEDWLEYTIYSYKNEVTNIVSTDVVVWLYCLTEAIDDIYTPGLFALNFHRRNGKWFLGLEDGYIFDKYLGKDKTQGLSPEVHFAIKNIFPYHYD